MKKLFIILTIIIFALPAKAYDVYPATEHIKSIWYGTGVTINPRTGEKELETYKDYKERNQKAPYDQYYCLILPNKTYGYLVNRNRHGRVSYVYQNDGYMLIEKLKCIPNVDSYPVIHDLKEAK